MPHINKNLLILIIIIISASVMYFISGITPTNKIACTQEALICPDGSSVSRTGPKCEFAPCPKAQINFNNREKFTGYIKNISYQCHMDGICAITVDNKNVIVGQGETVKPQPKGTSSNIELNESKKNDYIGQQVEVSRKKVSENNFTIYGDNQYYIKLTTNKSASTKYVCPENEYVDCMLGPDKIKLECSPQYLQWAKANCPNFRGATY